RLQGVRHRGARGHGLVDSRVRVGDAREAVGDPRYRGDDRLRASGGIDQAPAGRAERRARRGLVPEVRHRHAVVGDPGDGAGGGGGRAHRHEQVAVQARAGMVPGQRGGLEEGGGAARGVEGDGHLDSPQLMVPSRASSAVRNGPSEAELKTTSTVRPELSPRNTLARSSLVPGVLGKLVTIHWATPSTAETMLENSVEMLIALSLS